MKRIARTLPPLLGAHLRRLLREGMVRRALAFPVLVTFVTLLGTIAVVGTWRGLPTVAVGPEVTATDRQAFKEAGLWIEEVEAAADAVRAGDAVATFDGTRLTAAPGPVGTRAEAVLRETRGTWRLQTAPPPDARFTARFGGRVFLLLAAIYALYGVVFGAGTVARDRDDRALKVELCLPVPRWVHGVVRITAGALILAGWNAVALAFTAALLGIESPVDALVDGVAGSLVAVGLGLASVGRSGIKSGFAATLAVGLAAATALFGLGWALPMVGQFLPLASIIAGGAAPWPLVTGGVIAALCVALFTLRSARAG